MNEGIIYTAILLAAAHFVADYPLQGDYLAKGKAEGYMRRYHLIAHSGIHAGAVTLITGSAWLGLAEWIAHAVIDECKLRRWISYKRDQQFHLVCKGIWIALIAMGIS